jgi:chitodextrinase
LNTGGLSNGTHTLEAKAIDPSGNIGYSSIVSVTVNNSATPPSTPTGLTAGAIGTSTISFSWNPSSQGTYPIAGYSVYRSGTKVGATTGTSYTDAGLVASTTYSYTVSAYDTKGNSSAQSSPLLVTTKPIPPPTVSITSPTNGQTVSGTVTISGSAGSSIGLSSIQISIDGGSYAPATGTTSWTYPLNTGGLSNGTHTITAEATDIGGNTNTASITIVVSNVGSALVIANVSVNHLYEKLVNISWTTNLSADGTFLYGTSPTSLTSSTYNAKQTTNHYVEQGGLTKGTTYYYLVASNDPGLGSASSSVMSFTTAASPDPALDPTAALASTGNQSPSATPVALSWNDPDPATTYQSIVIVRKTNGFSTNPTTDSQYVVTTLPAGTTSYTDTSALPNQTYYYSIFMEDSQGDLSLPAEIKMTTPSFQIGSGGGTTAGNGGGSGGSIGITTNPTPPISSGSLTAELPTLTTELQSLTTQMNTQIVASFTRNLSVGEVGSDVRNLQLFLNNNGYPIATSGPGSVGNESTYFGQKTQAALAKWQKANNLPDTGYFGSLTRGVMGREW